MPTFCSRLPDNLEPSVFQEIRFTYARELCVGQMEIRNLIWSRKFDSDFLAWILFRSIYKDLNSESIPAPAALQVIKVVVIVMSKAWSCETLMVGFQDVMSDALSADELALRKEIEDPP